ncbi:rho guanine nucleotide exchange factor 18a isoform X1 [Takifugu rubripes]|uniref:Rho/rac guanine nucleotide exchange factor (GEF) 18a n=2 Tax=Takifugu rubripes TaxID=31033 RepID=H2SZR2_TAKRU|nr:rho guanine nucleotide exchange factor 18-like isoform X1 [Takifugu rubripes]XP_029686559.1 rho guanine nucleotide exchange factor 18-like isoform X1 [Takifugu rubripes]
MTVASRKHSPQPGSSSSNETRSGLVQMDEVDGLRLRQSSEDSVSLAPSLAEPINLEDLHYAQVRGELEYIAQNLEAESWSVAVDQSYLKSLNKEAVKRQDVIYEFIQTEMHHVRTLKVLLQVYMYELRRSQLIEDAKLEQLFLSVEELLSLHQHFLSCLKARQEEAQPDESPNNYQITQFGDILVSQFSGAVGERMVQSYSVFCSHHNESINIYKEQMQNNKKMQILMRKIGQLPLVRRLGISECFMLVTQRITKYPILVERIIQNTEGDTEEQQTLVQGLALIKDAISQVNNQVRQYEKAARLREIGLRLEPKSQGRQKDGLLFHRDDLINGTRTLLHEGTVTWKSSGRHKEIHALLLSDVLVLLQEKDQKLVFAGVDNKPPIISLKRLLVREVAREDKAMFLINVSTSMAEMYELHTSSRQERLTWLTLISDAIEQINALTVKEDIDEMSAELQQLQDALRLCDEHIKQCLTKKQEVFAALYKNVMKQEIPHKGLLLRGDASDFQQGETLLAGAIREAEYLQNRLISVVNTSNPLEDDNVQDVQLGREDPYGAGDSNMKSDAADEPSGMDDLPGYSLTPKPSQELLYSESTEQSADDDDTNMPESRLVSSQFPLAEMCERVILLAQRLYTLQTIVAQQDSQIELQNTFQSQSKQPTRNNSVLLEQEKQRNQEKHKEALANLQKLQAQHREEQRQWEKERERQRIQMEALEAQLQQREEECRTWEEKLQGEKTELEEQRGNYQEGLERLRETTKSVEKEKDRLSQEKERLEQQQEKLKKYIPNPGLPQYDDPSQYWSYQSFRGSIANGGGGLPTPLKLNTLINAPDVSEVPPKVPPRKESMAVLPAKPELPIQLISTTNQVHKPAAVQQQIPTKLAALSKGKDKGLKGKASHKRTNSAASIDVSQLVPIRVTGKEGGSLRAKRNSSPQRIQSGTFSPPESLRSVKSSQSFSTLRSSSEVRPPAPPPFPKELEKGKERVIFL